MKEITVENFNHSNIKEWISSYRHKEKVEFAIKCAELVIHLYNGKSDASQKAIDAAKALVINPSRENKAACKYAATAACAAYDDTDSDAYACAANAAAYAAASAAYYADDDAYAAAAHEAVHASYAAAADASVKEKIIGLIKLNLQPKPRPNTDYVKVHKSNTPPSEFCQMIVDGVKFYDGEHCGGHYDDVNAINRYGRGSQSLYRKVEKEIDWREEVNDFFLKAEVLGTDHLISNGIEMKELGSEFIKMCRLVESLTRHIEV